MKKLLIMLFILYVSTHTIAKDCFYKLEGKYLITYFSNNTQQGDSVNCIIKGNDLYINKDFHYAIIPNENCTKIDLYDYFKEVETFEVTHINSTTIILTSISRSNIYFILTRMRK